MTSRYIARSITVARTEKHMKIPVSIVERARDHLTTCVCLGSAGEAAADLEAFLNDHDDKAKDVR